MSSCLIMPNEVQRWRERSEEMRVLSEDVKDAKAKALMLRIAEDYGRLAKYAEDQKVIHLRRSSNTIIQIWDGY